MKTLIIGTGAAGNKAVINLLEQGVVDEEDVLLLNTALTDIPKEYRDKAIKLSEDFNGCGKERTVGKAITTGALIQNTLQLKNRILDGDYEKVTIVTSIEGGTGSGSTATIADFCSIPKNFKNAENPDGKEICVEICAFVGFGKDARGLANSVDFFYDMKEEYRIQTINNSAFLKEAGNVEPKAEKLANDELANRMLVTSGALLNSGDNIDCNNIDPEDLYKLAATTGYTMVRLVEVSEKIKSVDEYNQIISEAIDSDKSIPFEEPSSRFIAVIANLQKSSRDNIDYRQSVLREKLGEPYDLFDHIYTDPSRKEFIAIVASGLMMPRNAIFDMNDRYKEKSSSVNKSRDNFFTDITSIRGNKEDLMFNMISKRSKIKAINSGNVSEDFINKYKNDIDISASKPKKTIKNNSTLISKSNDNSEY